MLTQFSKRPAAKKLKKKDVVCARIPKKISETATERAWRAARSCAADGGEFFHTILSLGWSREFFRRQLFSDDHSHRVRATIRTPLQRSLSERDRHPPRPEPNPV
ncbi:hypothetical protein EVAR_15141_1 [Eumeta japonica]|uniref:Uncharacterized protein n=1 Tax=Eumeta variegata TaxID=151549 RepID=A0A4C1UJ55_EUMVA|nr:hypothetical protein EVAR_15141_1 [Eumeta japonica]